MIHLKSSEGQMKKKSRNHYSAKIDPCSQKSTNEVTLKESFTPARTHSISELESRVL